jgi:hypothetical protein
MTAAKTTIAAKLAAAIGEVDRIGKDGTNSHFKYTYTSAEQVYRVVRKPLLDQGLVVIPSVAESVTQGQTTITKLHLRLIDTESGESIEAFWMGEGQDKGDKGPYKAATGGMKTWLKHLFLLPADDDPEGDTSTDAGPLPYGLPRLEQAGRRMDKREKAAVGEWVFNGTETPDPDRLKVAIDHIEAGQLGVLAEIVKRA